MHEKIQIRARYFKQAMLTVETNLSLKFNEKEKFKNKKHTAAKSRQRQRKIVNQGFPYL